MHWTQVTDSICKRGQVLTLGLLRFLFQVLQSHHLRSVLVKRMTLVFSFDENVLSTAINSAMLVSNADTTTESVHHIQISESGQIIKRGVLQRLSVQTSSSLFKPLLAKMPGGSQGWELKHLVLQRRRLAIFIHSIWKESGRCLLLKSKSWILVRVYMKVAKPLTI